MPVVCSRCDEASPTDPPPIGWGRAVEDGRVEHTCPTCTREHVRAMEGRLAPAHW